MTDDSDNPLGLRGGARLSGLLLAPRGGGGPRDLSPELEVWCPFIGMVPARGGGPGAPREGGAFGLSRSERSFCRAHKSANMSRHLSKRSIAIAMFPRLLFWWSEGRRMHFPTLALQVKEK